MCGSKLLIVRRVYPRGRKSGEKPGNKKGKHMAEKLKQTFTKGVGDEKTNWRGILEIKQYSREEGQGDEGRVSEQGSTKMKYG